ncbi:SDR family oxidoreductase [Paraburkholderia phosphatilytica]|uniref:SDR family oxidoreductase n=1 Tax=Paraburkholderia phosphatilytica TaxID=2282883 RepID=UPI000E54E2BF|nr:SDR family oxidoreductase [Paraburkholderia phosphatilytica]
MGALDRQIAIVTGGGSGIGRSTALRLAAEGARVVVVGRRLDTLEAVAREIGAAGGQAYARQVDLQKRAEMIDMVRWVEAELGTVDILVNNAGASSRVRNIQWIDEADWDSTVSVNLTAVYVLIQAVLPGMLARGGGTVITVSSLAAVRPSLLGGAPYGAAKAGVRNLMTYLHSTFRNNHIRSTTILPGEVNTPIMDTRVRPPSAEERAAMVSPDDVAQAVLLCCTLPARTTIEELVISPTLQRDQGPDTEISRWLGAPDGVAPANVPGKQA